MTESEAFRSAREQAERMAEIANSVRVPPVVQELVRSREAIAGTFRAADALAGLGNVDLKHLTSIYESVQQPKPFVMPDLGPSAEAQHLATISDLLRDQAERDAIRDAREAELIAERATAERERDEALAQRQDRQWRINLYALVATAFGSAALGAVLGWALAHA